MFTVGSRHLDAGGGREQSLFKIVNPVPQPNFPPSQASVPIKLLVFYRTVQSVTTENVSKMYRTYLLETFILTQTLRWWNLSKRSIQCRSHNLKIV